MKRIVSCLLIVLLFLLSVCALFACNVTNIQINLPDQNGTIVSSPDKSDIGSVSVSIEDSSPDKSESDSSSATTDVSSVNDNEGDSSSAYQEGSSSSNGIFFDESGEAWSPWM